MRGRLLAFETHYTLAFDRSDDDNERDPFTLRYADAGDLAPEYGWSDRDRRHQVSGYLLIGLPGDVHLNNVVRYRVGVARLRAVRQPGARGPPSRRIGSARTEPSSRATRCGAQNAFFTWDLRVSRRFALGGGAIIEPILEIFNVTNADNFVDPAVGFAAVQLRRVAPERARRHPAGAGGAQRAVLTIDVHGIDDDTAPRSRSTGGWRNDRISEPGARLLHVHRHRQKVRRP